MMPAGASVGDLYVVLTPANWIAGADLKAAHVEICNPSFELISWAKNAAHFDASDQAQFQVTLPERLRLTQLALENNQAYRWMRQAWDPSADGGAGAWMPVTEEIETVDVTMHTPKNWDATTRETAGGSAYPISLRGGATSIAGTAGLYDPAERGTEGTLVVGLLDPSFETGTDLDSQPLLAGADWRTNGRFFGILHVPEATARTYETITFAIAKGDKVCSQNPLLRWNGQVWNSLNCPQPWSHETRYPAGEMTPYLLAPAADTRVSAGAITVYADNDKLRLRIEPPVGETIKLTADLSCVTSGTGVCL